MRPLTVVAGCALVLALVWAVRSPNAPWNRPLGPAPYELAMDRFRDRALRAARPRAGRGMGIWDLAYTPDGRQIVLGGPGGLEFLDAESLETLSYHDPPRLHRLAVHPSGELLALGTGGEVEIYAIPGVRRVHRFVVEGVDLEKRKRGHTFPTYPRFSPDGRHLAVYPSTDDLEIRLYRTEDWAFLRSVHGDRAKDFTPRQILFSADSRELAVVDFGRQAPDAVYIKGGGVQFYDIETGSPTRLVSGPKTAQGTFVMYASIPRDGRFMVGLADKGHGPPDIRNISVWSWDRPTEPEQYWGLSQILGQPTPDGPAQFSISVSGPSALTPDGRTYVMAGSNGFALWDVEARKKRFLALAPAETKHLAISPDSRRAALLMGGSTVLLMDIEPRATDRK